MTEIEKKYPQRTKLQNNSLHLGCKLLAENFKDAGIDQKKVMEKLPEILAVQCTMGSMKAIYKILINAMYGYDSTTQLNTFQVSESWEKLLQILMREHGTEIDVPFPNEEQTKAYMESLKNN